MLSPNEKIKAALVGTGFEVCKFGPDEYGCEKCGTPHLQLYFRGPTDAGQYHCAQCVCDEFEQNQAEDWQVTQVMPGYVVEVNCNGGAHRWKYSNGCTEPIN